MKKFVVIFFAVIVLVAFAGRALLYWNGLQVTSWYRTPWKNSEVGGKWYSLHQIGWAYDVIPVNMLLQTVLRVRR
jgi:uncharacterized protein YcbK (DUF882 family)